MSFLLLAFGFVLLIKGADFLVNGGVSIAKKYKIPSTIIGMTIVAFGTTAPELVVNVIGSVNGSGELVFGNIIGSNITNILLILGISTIIYPLTVDDRVTILRYILYSFVATIVCFVFVARSGLVNRVDGVILLSIFVYFLYSTFSGKHHLSDNSKIGVIKARNSSTAVIFVVLGILGLTSGGKLVIDGATQIARSFGVNESVIGLTIVALGTSLPELFTSVVAAVRKNTDIAIGNVIGSNIFNLLWILGISAVIRPINVSDNAYLDVISAGVTTLLLFSFLQIGKKHKLTRIHGVTFLILYIVYMVTMFAR